MTRTLFIGIDGATFDVLDDLCADAPGRGVVMPFLKRFMESGFRAVLRSTPLPLTPPAWTSMTTGKGPGHHGIFDFMRSEDKGNEVFFTLYDFRDIRTETVWSIASRQDRQVVSLNFPMTAPPPKINGSVIPGFTSWRHMRRNSHPGDLFDRLAERIAGLSPKALAWDFEKENEVGEEMAEDHLADWIAYHLPREQQWARVASALLQEDRPDLLGVMFDGTDKIQHQAWHCIDPTLRPTPPYSDGFAKVYDLCLEYFRGLDRYIEGLVGLAGDDAQVFLASDHGFTATSEVVRINRYLADKGYLTYHDVADTDSARRRANSPFAFLDWDRTTAYCPTPSSNGIRIRVRRQPGDPGIAPEHYQAFRARLIADLRELRSPATGAPVVRDILLREEAFPGRATDDAPDLTLELGDHGFVSIRNLEPPVVPRNYPAGTHHPDGIFIAGGAGMVAGVRDDKLEIADVAATLLYSLGLPVPEDFEGHVALNCFTAEYVRANPVVRGPATLPVGSRGQSTDADSGDDVADAEKQKIVDQLVMLGYLEE